MFQHFDHQYITIADICQQLHVSSATVRNWIKMGDLKIDEAGNVDYASFEHFKNTIVGKSKLNKRANKLSKKEVDIEMLKQQFLYDLEQESIDVEQAGVIYQNILSDVDRNKEGIYYTDNFIIDDMLKYIYDFSNKTFCDPCCGSGNFIIKALEKGVNPHHIYGFDTDPIAVKIARKRFKKMTGLDGVNNIQCVDFLEYSLKNSTERYDYIYTNPPWGKKITKSEKNKISKTFSLPVESVNDTCSLFFMICLRHLTTSGAMGFLLPDAVFNIGVYEQLRELMLENNLFRLSDYGKAFKGLQTGAVLCEVQRKYDRTSILCESKSSSFERTLTSFLNNPKKIFNIHCSQDEALVIDYIYSLPHFKLDSYIEWGLGIVTGNNDKYVKTEPSGELVPIYKGSDILPKQLKEPSCFIDKDLSLYQQVAPWRLYQAKEKLIYKFISSKLVFYYDNQQRLILNSANMLISTEQFPISLKVLADYLSSDFINWLFQKIFNTHKILRGDLECLPIHQILVSMSHFDEEIYLKELGLEVKYGTFRVKK